MMEEEISEAIVVCSREFYQNGERQFEDYCALYPNGEIECAKEIPSLAREIKQSPYYPGIKIKNFSEESLFPPSKNSCFIENPLSSTELEKLVAELSR